MDQLFATRPSCRLSSLSLHLPKAMVGCLPLLQCSGLRQVTLKGRGFDVTIADTVALSLHCPIDVGLLLGKLPP